MAHKRVSTETWIEVERLRRLGLTYKLISLRTDVPSGTIGGYFSSSGRHRRAKIRAEAPSQRETSCDGFIT